MSNPKTFDPARDPRTRGGGMRIEISYMDDGDWMIEVMVDGGRRCAVLSPDGQAHYALVGADDSTSGRLNAKTDMGEAMLGDVLNGGAGQPEIFGGDDE